MLKVAVTSKWGFLLFLYKSSLTFFGHHNTFEFLKYIYIYIFFKSSVCTEPYCIVRYCTWQQRFDCYAYMCFLFFLSLLSNSALHHFNCTTPTERGRQRAERGPSAAVTQRTTSGPVLRYPLWRRARVCWLVKQRTCPFKDSQTNHTRVTTISTVFLQSTSFLRNKSL